MQQKTINKSKIPNSNNNIKNNIHNQNQGNKRPVSSNPIRKNSGKVKTNQINIPTITNSNK